MANASASALTGNDSDTDFADDLANGPGANLFPISSAAGSPASMHQAAPGPDPISQVLQQMAAMIV